jgi:hypothetical protein
MLAPPWRHDLEPSVVVLLLPVGAWALGLGAGALPLGAANTTAAYVYSVRQVKV